MVAQVPDRIAAAARRRLQATMDQQFSTLRCIAANRPLDAEKDVDRRNRRFRRVTAAAGAAASGGAPPMDAVPEGEEKVQGLTADFVPVAFLDLATAAASSVCRVAFTDQKPQGSGFMISDRLFMTNHHVIESAADAKQFLLEFQYEVDVGGQPRQVTRFQLDPDTFFVTQPKDGLDYTVVAVGQRVAGGGELKTFGYCPLSDSDDKHMLGEFVNIVQHPEGEFKQIVLRENRLVARFDTVLHYLADTRSGSSGSPVLNDQWEVIALHHWGEPHLVSAGTDGAAVSKEANEGIRISAVVAALRKQRAKLTAAQRDLLDAALEMTRRAPSNAGASRPPRSENVAEEPPAGTPTTPPDPAPVPAPSSSGAATFTVPLEITVRIGGGGGATAQVSAGGESSGAEKVAPNANYANRHGYNPKFLAGHTIPLPKPSKLDLGALAELIDPKPGADPHELRYEHFSVVMNAGRRMAYVTAVNIDGKMWKRVDRKTGKVAAEATETWYADPRIRDEDQTEQSLYDKQLIGGQPQRVFDRGHLVRREDPTWGSAASAEKANADTFHFANCTPQEFRFNERAEYWQGIEQFILERGAVEDRIRISVFTGPVFRKDDPKYRYIRVPMQFWKVVVRVEDGELKATALVAPQKDLIEETGLPESMAEGLDDTSAVAEYQTTVEEIEKMTRLDFGELRDHDTFAGGGESASGTRRILRSFDDIKL